MGADERTACAWTSQAAAARTGELEPVCPTGALRLTLAATLLSVACLSGPSRAQVLEAPTCGLEPGPTRSVAAIIDGDTLRLDDGKELRLLGVLAPKGFDGRTSSDGWPPAIEAEKALRNRVQGRSVWLAFAGDREDRYGRVLAHVFMAEAERMIWLQQAMVEAGHLRVAPQPGDGCMRRLLSSERLAREAGLGLWNHAAYQLRPADRPRELERYRGTFQLILGRVRTIVWGRNVVRLEFESSEAKERPDGAREPRALHLVAPRSLIASEPTARKLRAGSTVLARGWVAGSRAPEIVLHAASQMEIVDSPPDHTRPDEKRPATEPPGVSQLVKP